MVTYNILDDHYLHIASKFLFPLGEGKIHSRRIPWHRKRARTDVRQVFHEEERMLHVLSSVHA